MEKQQFSNIPITPINEKEYLNTVWDHVNYLKKYDSHSVDTTLYHNEYFTSRHTYEDKLVIHFVWKRHISMKDMIEKYGSPKNIHVLSNMIQEEVVSPVHVSISSYSQKVDKAKVKSSSKGKRKQLTKEEYKRLEYNLYSELQHTKEEYNELEQAVSNFIKFQHYLNQRSTR